MTAPATSVVVEADGGSRGNPGPAGYGALVLDPREDTVLLERSASIGTATNNVAEYRGLIAGLTAARELGARRVAVRMDAKLVIEQMSGRWKVRHADMQVLHREARELAAGFDEVTYEWMPRERNTRADRLANEAMDAASGVSRVEPVAAASWTPPTGHATRLVLVRHGATAHSAERRFSGRNELSLADTGRAQAAALAARQWGRVDAIVSSPLRRAVETAEAIAPPLDLGVQIVDELIEADFGAWEGLSFAEAASRDGAALAAWRSSPDAAPPGGESFAAVAARVRRALEQIVAEYPERVVLAVSHVTPIKQLIRLALDAPPTALFRLHLDTASVSAVDYFADGNCSVRLVNDTSHLPR